MEQYLADLHIHSRHSRATSKGLTPRNVAAWAEVKGLTVVGTGDFTHPGWLDELKDVLAPDGTGLFRLKDPAGLSAEIPWLAGLELTGRTRFILSAEISSIYKKAGQVRKIHNLAFAPSFEAAERLNLKLSRVGNLASDGRPILGLDARNLLEMVLESDPFAFLIPAHVWTPWFSLFGSKSGFDSVAECFGDLSGEIFALETGLSSDPEMNWLLSSLDRFRLVSNSDAHSGEKLGREANILSGDPSFEGLYRALRGQGVGPRFLGTIEFFPEEGKYHLDGHRQCGVVMEPREAKARGGLCPVCGKPMTLGVLHRVLELADRTQPQKPETMPGFTSLIPLSELAGEVLDQGPGTKKVRELLARLFSRLGPELYLLRHAPIEDIGRVNRLLAEAVSRMRRGDVIRHPGFDGQYGRIHVFTPEEKREASGGRLIVPAAPAARRAGRDSRPRSAPGRTPPAAGDDAPPDADGDPPAEDGPNNILAGLNPGQAAAALGADRHVLVLAGPGTGKTRTLIARVAALLSRGADPRSMLVVTFTRRAAGEIKERLAAMLPSGAILPRADTLHALAHEVWTGAGGEPPVLLSEEAGRRLFASVNPEVRGARLKAAWQALNLARERLGASPVLPEGLDREGLAAMAGRYAEQKTAWNLVDFTDLLEFWLDLIRRGGQAPPGGLGLEHILVDEVQDLSPLQLALIQSLADQGGTGVFAIGDPNQSIYAFRGAAPAVREALAAAWPDLAVLTLGENYRSTQPILDLAAGLFPGAPALVSRVRREAGGPDVALFTAPTAAAEVGWIGERIRGLIGGASLTLAADLSATTLSPGDIAVLARFQGLMEPIRRSLDRLGIPCSAPQSEVFWNEPRVRRILDAAGRLLGLAGPEGPGPGERAAPVGLGLLVGPGAEAALPCPDRVLARGPEGLPAHLADVPPFDRLFWQGPDFRRLCRSFAEHGGWAGLLSFIHTQGELELIGRAAEKVRILTVHAAKGLEFEAVFLPALEDGILPFAGADFLTGKATAAAGHYDEAEEKRLLYVGLTRAKSRLYLSHAVRRELYGRLLMLKPSRFLDKLPLETVRRSSLVAHKVSQQKRLSLI